MIRIETKGQLDRTVQALNETLTVIERLQKPQRTSREEAAKLLAELSTHAETLKTMIAEARV